MSGAQVVTLGCRLNLAESETLRARLGGADGLVVVNSCAVTAEAMRATRAAIRRVARANPAARVVVTGCASEIERDAFLAMAEVADVVPNADKLDTRRYGAEPAAAPVAPAHARAFVPVQTGCDHRCTFCIIPYGRGPSRSVPAGEVVATVRAAVAAGQAEVVLTGVDLTAYGADLPGTPTLGMLVERLLRLVPELSRLRLSSLDACEIDERLFALIAGEPRVMPHLHLSLQAGDDMVLKRMKRRHSRADAVALVERVRAARPEVAIGADLIAGFPTESEAMFANTLALIEDIDIVLPHVFPFSPRAGTPAARMPQVEREVARARAARLREAGAVRTARWLAGHVGTVQRVLVELDRASGHAEDFARVVLGQAAAPGRIADVRITGVQGDALLGVAA